MPVYTIVGVKFKKTKKLNESQQREIFVHGMVLQNNTLSNRKHVYLETKTRPPLSDVESPFSWHLKHSLFFVSLGSNSKTIPP